MRYSFGWAQGHQLRGRGHKNQVRKQKCHTTKKQKERKSICKEKLGRSHFPKALLPK